MPVLRLYPVKRNAFSIVSFMEFLLAPYLSKQLAKPNSPSLAFIGSYLQTFKIRTESVSFTANDLICDARSRKVLLGLS